MRAAGFTLLLAGCVSPAGSANVMSISWEELPPLPPSAGQSKQPGVAGPFAGVHRDALIVAGGANFPDKMPWEGGHTLELRLEAFNVTNTQRMGALTGGRTGYGVGLDPGGAPYGCTTNCALSPFDGVPATPLTPPTIWSN